jgi:AraC-like DNA-binding protein
LAIRPRHAAFETELTLGLIYRSALRLARGDNNDAEEVWFSHATPEYAERYAEVFRCRVRFGRPRDAILFPRACLDARHAHGNHVLLDVLVDGAERLLAEQRTPTLPDRVRAILQHEVDLRRITSARVAYLLNLDPRAFRMQLSKADTSWSDLVDEARCRIACRELQRGERRLRELGERLGFSNQSAFSRAFKRWTGMTASRYLHDPSARSHLEAAP